MYVFESIIYFFRCKCLPSVWVYFWAWYLSLSVTQSNTLNVTRDSGCDSWWLVTHNLWLIILLWPIDNVTIISVCGCFYFPDLKLKLITVEEQYITKCVWTWDKRSCKIMSYCIQFGFFQLYRVYYLLFPIALHERILMELSFLLKLSWLSLVLLLSFVLYF